MNSMGKSTGYNTLGAISPGITGAGATSRNSRELDRELGSETSRDWDRDSRP